VRTVSLFEKAWRDGVPIAAYAPGHLYETGAGAGFHADVAKPWAWHQKGADAGEPTALARFGERDDRDALAEKDAIKANALLLRAFQFYAAAAGRAHDEAWMDEAWKSWRYRCATLARLLAHEGMMPQAADAHRAAHDQGILRATTPWEGIKARISW
jgi:TPR repeat protein